MKRYSAVVMNLILILVVALGACWLLKTFGLKQEFGYVDESAEKYVDVYPGEFIVYSVEGVLTEGLPVRLELDKEYESLGVIDEDGYGGEYEGFSFEFSSPKTSIVITYEEGNDYYSLEHTMLYIAGFSSIGILAVILLLLCVLNLGRVYLMFSVHVPSDDNIIKMNKNRATEKFIFRFSWMFLALVIGLGLVGFFLSEMLMDFYLLKDLYFLVAIVILLVFTFFISIAPLFESNYTFEFTGQKLIVTKGKKEVFVMSYANMEYDIKNVVVPSAGINTKQLVLIPLSAGHTPFKFQKDVYNNDVFEAVCKKIKTKVNEKGIEVLSATEPSENVQVLSATPTSHVIENSETPSNQENTDNN